MPLSNLSGNTFESDMAPQFPLKDGREYVHSSDILAFALRFFSAMKPDKIVVDFLKPTTSKVHLVLQETPVDPAVDGAFFTVKVVQGQALHVYRALPLTGQAIDESVDSHQCVASEKYSPTAIEVTSSAQTVADFFNDLNWCMKNHWHAYNHQNRALLVRRMELRMPFSVPTGVSIKGEFKKLKLGAQAWHFTAPTLPEFDFSVIGLYQAA